MTSDAASPFDEDIVAEAAAQAAVDRDALIEALESHQRSMADLPGVDNLVYEWRKRYDDPLVDQTDRAYRCVLPETVWAEFGAHLDLDSATLDALRAVHERQVARRVDPGEPPAGETFLLLARGDDWPRTDR